MDAALIDILNENLPGNTIPSVLEGYDMKPGQFNDQAMQSFVSKYTDLAFGWKAAQKYAQHRKIFPVYVGGRDAWLYRAYLYNLNPVKYRDRAIEEAHALFLEGRRGIAAQIEALLLVPDNTTYDISMSTGLNLDVVDAYVTLFYNVIDRRSEAACLSQHVFPDTRFVTFRENYFNNASTSDLLRRAGYDGENATVVSYMAGLPVQDCVRTLQGKLDSADRLQAAVISEAFMVALAGLSGQGLGSMRTARSLMVADKQGGTQTPNNPMANIAGQISAQLDAAQSELNQRRKAVAAKRYRVVEAEEVE